MSKPFKNRSSPDSASNHSSDESFFNDCEACCYEVHHTPPFPHKCVYDDVLQQYKMRLKRCQMELTDKDLLITMLRDQHVKMETYCRNSLDETQNMRTRYISAVEELENLKKHYEIQNDQKSKQVNASHEALEALFKAEVDRWNKENQEILNRIEIIDFDIQKLIQIMADKSERDEQSYVRPHLEKIEKLIANQSAILNSLAFRVEENASAIAITNQEFGSKLKELMTKTEVSHTDLIEEIEDLKKRSESIAGSITKKVYSDLKTKPADGENSQFPQRLISPVASVDEQSMEHQLVKDLEKSSIALDANEDVTISIQIQHAHASKELANSNGKSGENSSPSLGK